MKYDFPDFSIDLSEASEIEQFDNRPDYYGVIFKSKDGSAKYDIIHNLLMGYRICISNNEWLIRDMPFNKNTAHFLPEEIKVVWKINENLV